MVFAAEVLMIENFLCPALLCKSLFLKAQLSEYTQLTLAAS